MDAEDAQENVSRETLCQVVSPELAQQLSCQSGLQNCSMPRAKLQRADRICLAQKLRGLEL
jgi:hypothetical protein